MAEQQRLRLMLERQQRILKQSKLFNDFAVVGNQKGGPDRSAANQACEALVEDVLNLSIFRQFLINQEHHTLKKQITHLAQEESILQSDYLKIWENSIKYDLYQALTESEKQTAAKRAVR